MSKYSPTHYQRGYIEVWDFIEDQDLCYFLGNVIKYVCRAGYKPEEHMLEDLKSQDISFKKNIHFRKRKRKCTMISKVKQSSLDCRWISQ
ncbi:MAG: hypothetical protein CM15mV125_100 [uncultured marine virus]|nr:MAG: hypothetical protein CM15mV125_100 [uncultured marine virus]